MQHKHNMIQNLYCVKDKAFSRSMAFFVVKSNTSKPESIIILIEIWNIDIAFTYHELVYTV